MSSRPTPSTTPLRPLLGVLTRFSGSELAERSGLREVTERLLHLGLRDTVRAGNEVRSRFTAARELVPDQLLKRRPASPKSRFDLNPSEDQAMTREVLRRFALDSLRPAGASVEEDPSQLDPILEQLAELGLGLTAIPEALDGVGEYREPTSSVMMAEALAWGDMSLAIAGLAPRGFVAALTEFGSAEQQARYLPAFAEEHFVAAAVALVDEGPRTDASRPRCRAQRSGDGYRLDGVKVLVPLVDRAELFLVSAWVEGQGPRAFIVRADADGLQTKVEGAMAHTAAAMGRVVLDKVHVAERDVLGEGYDHERLVDLGRIGACGLAVGCCQAVLGYVTTYANERVAFGEPISHRQSVAFAIADIAIEVEAMRLMALRAASLAERGREFHEAAYLAHLQCSEHGMKIGSAGVQLLGGHGYVKEHPVERWYRQLRAIPMLEGTVVA